MWVNNELSKKTQFISCFPWIFLRFWSDERMISYNFVDIVKKFHILLSKFTNMWERKCDISVFQIKAILFWILVYFNILVFVSFTLPCFIMPEVLLLKDATVWPAKLDWAEVCYFCFCVYLSHSSPIMFLLNHSTASLCFRKRENLQLCNYFFFPQRAYV